MRAKPVGPFHQRDRRSEGIVEAQFPDLVGVGQPVQVGVPDLHALRLIDLDQREGGGRHLLLIPKAGADEGAGKAAFPGPDRAFQQDHVTSPGPKRELSAKSFGGLRVGQIKDKRGNGHHGATVAAGCAAASLRPRGGP